MFVMPFTMATVIASFSNFVTKKKTSINFNYFKGMFKIRSISDFRHAGMRNSELLQMLHVTVPIISSLLLNQF